MLVLARRPGQKILFPGLGISVEVLRAQGSVVRLGIEAPEEVRVLREELPVRTSSKADGELPGHRGTERQVRHAIRNRLNGILLKLQLLQRELDLGRPLEVDSSLTGLLAELQRLEAASEDEPIRGAVPRVLIVEDQANERELLADCLRLSGVEVLVAGNGREAFDQLHEQDLPDLVLLDMRMPEVDGPELLQWIREDVRLQNLRVFAVSGSEPHEFSPALPIDGWFSKPVRIDALLKAVRVDAVPANLIAS